MHIYDNNVYKRTLQLDLPSEDRIIRTVLIGGDYLLIHSDGNKMAAVDLNQPIQAKATFKTIQLSQMSDIYRLVWVPRDDDDDRKGYLFASEYLSRGFNSQIYELDLHAIPTTLTPLQIPFMNGYGYNNTFFICEMGADAILCYDACRKYSEATEKVNILKLEKSSH